MKIQRSRFLLSLYALFIAGSVATLYAVDGVILIDQNRALAGNVTPGDAPGFPVTITQPGSYRLSGNLTVPFDTNGIEIQVAHVTVDLNGFRIAGDGIGGIGVTTRDQSGSLSLAGITVRNGTITNFGIGILLSSVNVDSSSEVTQIRALDNNLVGIVAGRNAIVTGNIATGNFTGIAAGEGSTITGNTSSRNSVNGLGVNCPSTVVGNMVSGNPVPFNVSDAFACTFANNTPQTP